MPVDSKMYFILEFMVDAEMYNFVVMFCLSFTLFCVCLCDCVRAHVHAGIHMCKCTCRCMCIKICLVHFPHQQASKINLHQICIFCVSVGYAECDCSIHTECFIYS